MLMVNSSPMFHGWSSRSKCACDSGPWCSQVAFVASLLRRPWGHAWTRTMMPCCSHHLCFLSYSGGYHPTLWNSDCPRSADLCGRASIASDAVEPTNLDSLSDAHQDHPRRGYPLQGYPKHFASTFGFCPCSRNETFGMMIFPPSARIWSGAR